MFVCRKVSAPIYNGMLCGNMRTRELTDTVLPLPPIYGISRPVRGTASSLGACAMFVATGPGAATAAHLPGKSFPHSGRDTSECAAVVSAMFRRSNRVVHRRATDSMAVVDVAIASVVRFWLRGVRKI